MILSSHDACLDRQLVDRARQCVARGLLIGVAQLEQHTAGLHIGNPPLRRTLTGTHAGFGRLLGQRPVREDVDPDLAATLDVPVDGDTSGLDLPVGDVGVLQRLNAIVTEAHRCTAAGDATLPRVVLLTVLDLTGNQHDQLSVFSVAGACAAAASVAPVASATAGASSVPVAARPASVLVAVVPDAPLRRGRVPEGRSRRGRSAPAGTAAVSSRLPPTMSPL